LLLVFFLLLGLVYGCTNLGCLLALLLSIHRHDLFMNLNFKHFTLMSGTYVLSILSETPSNHEVPVNI
jgi:hypothetical protein